MANFSDDPEKFDSDAVKARMKESAYEYFQLIARNNGKAIGTVGVRPSFDPMDEVLWFEISNLIVEPKCQNQGYGGQILQATEEFCRAKGAGMVRLGVMVGEARLTKYYEQRGYSVKAKILCKTVKGAR
jgi:predicted N-acetyltransferase YhbS